jgi:hypothetical protein
MPTLEQQVVKLELRVFRQQPTASGKTLQSLVK